MDQPALNAPSPGLIDALTEVVGAPNALREPAEQEAYLREWRDRYFGRSALVLRPGSPQEVSRILELANDARVGIVPQGGNTGLVGGQIPDESGTQIVLCLSRLNRILSCSPRGRSLTCQAGAILSDIQAVADSEGLLFPLSLASEGSCQIGGNLAANAGGVSVLAYGNARELTLGIEAVFADGSMMSDLQPLKKNNTGYDLKNLLIGSEGTLAVITAATLKLFPKPAMRETAFLAVPSLDRIADLFFAATDAFASTLTAFEFLPARAMTFLHRHFADVRSPLGVESPWYVLIELSHAHESPEGSHSGLTPLEAFLSEAMEKDDVLDAVLAGSETQRNQLWRLRDLLSEVQKHEGGSIKHDISVPIGKIPGFIEEANRLVQQLIPGARPVPFGHFGDGNIHYNISQPVDADKQAFLARWDDLSAAIHDLTAKYGGAISAEHGIGQMKRSALPRYKSPAALSAMRAIKQALDPNGILNPGKLL